MAQLMWDEREQVILEAIASAEAERGRAVERLDELVEMTGLDRPTVLLGTRALYEASPGYVDAADAGALHRSGPSDDFLEIRLLERGRRATGQWPAEDAADALLDLIRSQADAASTAESRSRWERLLDAAKALGQDALRQLAISFFKQQAGM